MARPYTGYTGKKSRGNGVEKLADLSKRRWASAVLLGTYADRDKRGKPGQKSVHADYRAFDLRLNDPAELKAAAEWFTKQAGDALGIEFVCDYSWRGALRRAFGRAWRCDRQAWLPLAKGAVVGGGEKWANYLHIEIAPGPLAESGAAMEKAWRSVPKPKGVLS